MNVIEATRTEAPQPVAALNPRAVEPRSPALDGLRGAAILLVLVAQFWANVPHARDGTLATGWSKVAGYGGSGVVLFFVLSGFWIARGLIRQHGRAGYFGRFFLRRACRILPVYALLLGGSFLAAKILFPLNADLWEPTVSEHLPRWSHVVFMQNIFMALTGSQGCEWLNPTWSLAVEVQFYLLMPALVWFVAPRWLPVTAGLGIAGCWAFRWSMHAADAHMLVSSLTLPGRADSLFVGVLAACAWEHARARAWLHRWRRGVLCAACGAGGLFVLLSEGFGGDAWETGFVVAGSTLLSVCFAGLMVEVLAHERTWFARLLAARPVAFWGGISFFVYLAHEPVNSLLHAFVLQDWPQTIALPGMAVTLGSVLVIALLGAVSQRWLEGPLVAWSRRVNLGRWHVARVAPTDLPDGYAPPLVRWTRRLGAALARPARRVARVAVRVR